jgi:hypothetical protein
MRVVTKYFNIQVVETEMIPEMSAEQYAIPCEFVAVNTR